MVADLALQPCPVEDILPPDGAGTVRTGMPEEQGPEFQPTLGRDVFISDASHDKAVADSVCEALESAGVACFIAPRNVIPGEFYAESIVYAIDSAKALVLILSESSAASQHVLREVERAGSKGHPVVSFRIDTAPIPAGLEYFVNASQWLDASAKAVPRALPSLVDAVRITLAQASAAGRSKDNLGRVCEYFLPLRQRRGKERRAVLHAVPRGSSAGRDACAVQGPRLRPLLRLWRQDIRLCSAAASTALALRWTDYASGLKDSSDWFLGRH